MRQENVEGKDEKTGKVDAKNWPSKYYPYLYNYALCKLSDEELVKDLVQETFLVGLEGLQQYKQRCSEITWLTSILKYKIYKVYRSRVKNKISYFNEAELQNIAKEHIISDTSQTYQHLETLIYKEFYAAVQEFLHTLPIQWQKVFHMKYVENEDTPEICKKLKLSNKNYWVISHRL